MFECYNCGKKAVIWDSDFSFDEYGYDGDGIVSFYHCQSCGAEFECAVLAENSKRGELVRVVHCKDCKSYDNTYCGKGFGWCNSQGRGVTDEHFCADGEEQNDEG